MANDLPKEVLTTGQVARICKVAPRTVAKWFDSGQLRGYRIPGSKDRRIPLNQLIRFMQVHGMPLEGLETGHTRVLVLDDEIEFTALLRDVLAAEGKYTVEIAATIFEAGVLAGRNCPHVIVADVSLGGLQPKELCRFLRSSEEFQRTRLIAVSGAMTPGQGEALLQNGLDAYLRKPFEVRQLAKSIDDVISRG
ncbi:MAG: response regulator [Phycisphaerae bacterium]|nr:response regulator [Phycisphaerae bacterium]